VPASRIAAGWNSRVHGRYNNVMKSISALFLIQVTWKTQKSNPFYCRTSIAAKLLFACCTGMTWISCTTDKHQLSGVLVIGQLFISEQKAESTTCMTKDIFYELPRR
jgi:hypothetical protein